MSNETEYRLAHPDRVRYYDVRIDEFRDATEEDYQRLEARLEKRGWPVPIKRQSQFAFDDALYYAVSGYAVSR